MKNKKNTTAFVTLILDFLKDIQEDIVSIGAPVNGDNGRQIVTIGLAKDLARELLPRTLGDIELKYEVIGKIHAL